MDVPPYLVLGIDLKFHGRCADSLSLSIPASQTFRPCSGTIDYFYLLLTNERTADHPTTARSFKFTTPRI